MGARDCIKGGKMQPTDSTEVFAINMSSNSTLNEPRRDLESQITKDNGRRHSIWWTILIDLPLLFIVLTLVGLFELGSIPSHKAGFFCGDPALSFPMEGDTVTTAVLICGIFLGPLVIIFIIEAIFADTEYSERARALEACKKTFWIYRNYMYGLIFNFAIIEIMKGVMGRPRPTFFDICEPDTGKTCTQNEFVSSFRCTSTRFSKWLQKDASHSFPSGHTSLSVHCGLFLAWYLQKRAFNWRHRTVFVVPMVQLLCLSFASVASLTRITDRRHHWWDVLAGFIIGTMTCFYAVVLAKNFSTLKTTKDENTEDTPLQSSVRTLVYDTQRSIGMP